MSDGLTPFPNIEFALGALYLYCEITKWSCEFFLPYNASEGYCAALLDPKYVSFSVVINFSFNLLEIGSFAIAISLFVRKLGKTPAL